MAPTDGAGKAGSGIEGDEDLNMKVIVEAAFLQDIVDALGAMVEEAKFHFHDELIRIWVIDPATVAGVFVDITPSDRDPIQHYSVQEDGFTMGLNLEKIDNLLGYAEPEAPVQIEFGEKHRWRFNITMPGVDVDLAGIDPESVRNEPDRPSLDLPAKYRFTGGTFEDAVKLNDMFSDHCTLAVWGHQVQFIASGDDDQGTYTLEEGEGELEFLDHPSDRVESMYSLDYLMDMSKVLKDYDEITIRSGQDMPCMIQTELFDYMLAPRLDKTG